MNKSIDPNLLVLGIKNIWSKSLPCCIVGLQWLSVWVLSSLKSGDSNLVPLWEITSLMPSNYWGHWMENSISLISCWIESGIVN